MVGAAKCRTGKLTLSVFDLRLAGIMAELIDQNEPTPVRKFLLNTQRAIRYVIRATPIICAQKCKSAGSWINYHLIR